MEEALKYSLLPDKHVKSEAKKRGGDTFSALPSDIDEQLQMKSPAEIEKFLKSEEASFTSSQLLSIANRLGISTSKRQSKEALVNVIARHFEAGQMDMMIRSTRKDDS
tara:strand:+ start:7135 stop:7458 length:324 start_codon:yes stop_codon:yes gene_type:complete